ncbi:transcription antitermination factor NusB [Puia sp.]|jgi:N utilization substance protein B|uniref:transcription antitermination factor NusB n=1 Tax=Puia sp. TaxID=2045100 RepID=UPI002F40A48E
MISRRNIRVKVMQTLYSLEAQEPARSAAEETQKPVGKPVDPFKILQKHFDQSRQLLSYLIYFITEVSRYAETASRLRASKHLPTAEDLNVNIKLAGNELLWKMLEDTSLKKAMDTDKPQLQDNGELIRKLYHDLTATPEYQQYITVQGRDKKSERDILEFIFSEIMLASEAFVSNVEELFTNWDDDGEMVSQLVMSYLAKPGSLDFQEIVSKEKKEFAKQLLQTVIEKKEVVMDMIRPRLKNWDPERIATLDMILMEMGVVEFLYFETIPPKVTINEYIDLAKDYSTPQSGQFVNGILDNIHKDLVREDKMHKINFKAN